MEAEGNIILGDSREELKNIDAASVQTVYLDPPFNSNHNYTLTPSTTLGFSDIFADNNEYISLIEPLLVQCKRVLKPDGNLFFHISAKDMFIPEMLCRKYFKNVTPIFWKRSRSKNNVRHKMGATIDIIFRCAESSKSKFNMVYQPLDEYYARNSYKNKDERGHFALGHIVYTKTQATKNPKRLYALEHKGTTYAPESGWRLSQDELVRLIEDNRIYFPTKSTANPYKKIYRHESLGKPCTDLWDDIHAIAMGSEPRIYPTQKPINLLKRIIEMSTDKGDWVLDPVAGSGTTGKASRLLDRRFILIDSNPDAVKIMREQLK